MPIQQDILEAMSSKLGDHLAPLLSKLVQEEVEKRLPDQSRPKASAPTPKKRGRPRIPRALLNGREIKLDADPMVRHYEIRELERVAKRDNLTLEIL